MEHIVFYIKGEDPTGLSDKRVVLSYDSSKVDFNMDELTQIRFDNIFGELVTASALLNRVGIIKAQAANAKREAELLSKVKYAELFELYSNELTIRQAYKTKDGHKVIAPTNTAVDSKIYLDQVYQILLRKENSAKRDYDTADSFYWAIQDKCKKLNNVKENIKPEDFTTAILEGEVNGFLIKLKGA